MPRPASAAARVADSDLPTSRIVRPSEPPPTSVVRVTGPDSAPAVIVDADGLPAVGSECFGFRLKSELGRGAFGRVFLANQSALADRPVVLKIGTHLTDETRALARLQHPNVVPVYSFHRGGAYQAVCMPYLGPVTLGHVVHRLRHTDRSTLCGKALSTLIQDCRRTKQPAAPVPVAADAPPVPAKAITLDGLGGFGFVDAVVWIGRQLASGLAAAHTAGLVHSDIKPANILLSDDGRPMLLDFGVAFDRRAGEAVERIGGTRPYMAPEHLRSYRDQACQFDDRGDVYALGVILFELLAGRLPFEPVGDDPADDLPGRETVPDVRAFNPRVPPAVASIVSKCLAADPAERYQSADYLGDDLARQLARKRLKHAANPSTRELARKFAYRNRWVLAVAGTAVIGGAAAAGFAARDAGKAERLVAFEDAGRADRFEATSGRLRVALSMALPDREAALKATEAALADHAGLPADHAARLRGQAAGLMLDAARAAGDKAVADRAWLPTARDWNRRAEAAFADVPRAVFTQRAWLARLANDPAAADDAAARAAAVPVRSAADHRTEGLELMDQGRWREAVGHLEEAAAADSRDFWAAFALAQCSYRMGYDAKAVAAYDLCAALDPTVPGVFFNRGLAHLRGRQFAKAAADFTRVIDSRPEWADPYLNRASAREGAGDLAGAVGDLSQAIDLGHPPTAVLFARGRVLAKMGRAAEAKQDIDEAMRTEPTDERGWVSRGSNRMPKPGTTDPAAFADALGDFDRALKLNPRSLLALQFKARVYSMTAQNRKAADVLSDLLRHFPEALDALSGRAVMYARLGDRAAAHADAATAERLANNAPRTCYQLAGVYAMTSRTHPDDKHDALRLLASALRSGFGFDLLDKDRELDSVRQDADFQVTVADARRAFERQKQSSAAAASAPR